MPQKQAFALLKYCMPYSSFKTLDEIYEKFGVSEASSGSLFADTPEIAPSEALMNTLAEQVSLALNINTEKARSEMIVAPVLIEVRRALHRRISLFSGIDFSVDAERDLTGFCDFILSGSPDQSFLKAPAVCIVEAKNENIKSGYAQCAAEMIAARLFNQQRDSAMPTTLGVVTTGSNWKFLLLQDNTLLIDFDEYLISQVAKIIGILAAAFPALSA